MNGGTMSWIDLADMKAWLEGRGGVVSRSETCRVISPWCLASFCLPFKWFCTIIVQTHLCWAEIFLLLLLFCTSTMTNNLQLFCCYLLFSHCELFDCFFHLSISERPIYLLCILFIDNMVLGRVCLFFVVLVHFTVFPLVSEMSCFYLHRRKRRNGISNPLCVNFLVRAGSWQT